MIDYIYIVVACILSSELLLRSKFISNINSINQNIKKVLKIIISSNISDHWKEKMVPIYAFILFKKSLLILVILFLIIIMFSFFLLLSSKFLVLILSFKGILFSLLVSIVYLKLRIAFIK